LQGDHLLKDLPKFHMALAQQVRVRGMLQLLGMTRRQLLLCSRDCVDEDHVPHLDEKTSQKEARGMNPGTAIPIHRQRGGVNVRFQPWLYSTTAP
jgi:hypothetical protein